MSILTGLYEMWVPSNQLRLAEAEARMFDPAFVPSKLQGFTVATDNGYHIHTVTSSDALEYRSSVIGPNAAEVLATSSTHGAEAKSAPPTQTASGAAVERSSVVRQDKVDAEKPVLLLIHGFGGGCGLWSKNISALASKYNVFAIDVPGFARSEKHPEIDGDVSAEQAQSWFVAGIDGWRRAMGFDKMHVVGHSMGGYIAASFALKHSPHVEKLYLVSPFGIKKRSPPTMPGYDALSDDEKKKVDSEELNTRLARLPWYVRAAAWGAQKVGPMTLARSLGPLGKMFLARRGSAYDEKRYDYKDDRVTQYIYHCVIQCRSGERYFWALNEGFGYAKNPLMSLLPDLTMPVTFVYGKEDFITPDSGLEVEKRMRKAGREDVSVHVVDHAGHHCYASHAESFNKILLDTDGEREKTRVHPL